MAECPFCAGEVSDDLITFGGPCPKCFAEIPGEEAPTDPGLEVKSAQARRDLRRATFRSLIPVALAFPVVACMGVGAAFAVLRPDPEIVILDFDEGMDWPEPEIVAYDREAAVPEPARPKPRPGKASNGGTSSPAPATPTVDRPSLDRPGTASAPPRPRGFGLDVQTKRQSGVLTDPDQVRAMIGEKQSQLVKGLSLCYDRQLKADPELEGKWRIQYTVTKSGRTRGASAYGMQQRNADLESCIVDQIETRWEFDPIYADQPVRRTLTFRRS